MGISGFRHAGVRRLPKTLGVTMMLIQQVREEESVKAGQVSVCNELTRRTFLGAGIASGVLAAGGRAWAQQPAPAPPAPAPKGPTRRFDLDPTRFGGPECEAKCP